MPQWNDIRLTPKLLGLFLAVGLLPMAVLAWLAGDHAQHDLLADATRQLQSIREIKKGQIQDYMVARQHDLRFRDRHFQNHAR